VGRFGGEEFLVVLPGTNEHTAPVVAERVRGFIERHPIELPDRTLLTTVSIGISTVGPSNCLSTDEAIRRADVALYAAKAAGRNRSLSYSQVRLNAAAATPEQVESA
jgi:diguanylate cyclase (GGDEF)-like protein